MVEAFKKVQSDDRVMNRFQDNTSAVFQALANIPLLQGHLIEDYQILTGTNSINHGLQGPLTGWFITDISSPAVIYKAGATRDILTLVSDADTLISLWVF